MSRCLTLFVSVCLFFGMILAWPAMEVHAQKGQKKKGQTGMGNIKVADGFEATLFAGPPEVNYPTCLAAAPTGELFVGIDQNGSLDAKANRGKILRLTDSTGEGKADKLTVFTKVDSPRGLIVDRKVLYVLHPPNLTAYYDDDGDGVADRSEDLVKGIGRDLAFRGADHTTNGIRMGIDGWIYIAVGDYGFLKATGKDGKDMLYRGGGVVRVRPDGTELEVVSRGQRNIYDVAIDPLMNIFTRDNTNDGDGWDVRLSHVVQLGNYGYPTLFAHFGEEIIQPILDTGGGSPTGALFLSEPGFPGDTGQSLLTCEWGQSAIHRHPLTAKGASFATTFNKKAAAFISIARPTDIDVDGMGRLYVSSWQNGMYTFGGENVGFVARVVPKDHKAEPFPNLPKASTAELLKHMASASHVRRLATQREMLGRGANDEVTKGLEALMTSKESMFVRVAALFTYKQLLGAKAQDFLVMLAEDAAVREFALKALADRKPENGSVPIALFEKGLQDANPRVRLQAIIGLTRLGKKEEAKAILPLVADADPLISHIAVQSLISFEAADVCLAALEKENTKVIGGALRVLQSLHDKKVVDGLLVAYDQSSANRAAIFSALCRLYYKEADWTGKWWGTRPDTRGPYFTPVSWSETPRIGEQLKKALVQADADKIVSMFAELYRHRIELPGATASLVKLGTNPENRALVVNLLSAQKSIPAEAIPLLAEIASGKGAPINKEMQTKAIKALYRGAGGQDKALEAVLQGFAKLGEPGKDAGELFKLYTSFLRDTNNAKALEVFVKAAQSKDAGERELSLVVLMNLSGSKISSEKVKAAALKAADQCMKNPESAMSLLKAVRKTKSEDFAFQILTLTKSSQPDVQKEAQALVTLLRLDRPREDRKDAIKHLKYDDVLAAAQKEKGDADIGSRLFVKQGCIACHTVSKADPPKGPYLGDVAARYKRPELIESILKPNAKIAQGFETNVFVLKNGKTLNGFVTHEGGTEVEIRDAAGLGMTLKKTDIDERATSKISVMPEQLVDTLTVPELASILAYLEELNKQ